MWTVYHDHSLSGRIDFDKYRENSRIHPVAEISRPCIFLFLNEIMRFLLHYRKKHAKRRNIFDALLSFCASECEVGKPRHARPDRASLVISSEVEKSPAQRGGA